MAGPSLDDTRASPAPTQSRTLSSTHRLPTVSALDALQEVRDTPSCSLRTGIPSLDTQIAANDNSVTRVFDTGKVTEIWGPSGAGKTAVAYVPINVYRLQGASACPTYAQSRLQTAALTVNSGDTVVWIDAATSLSSARLQSVCSGTSFGEEQNKRNTSPGLLRRLTVPTLSHLLAVILHPPPDLLAEKVRLLVIEDVNHLVDFDYPRAQLLSASRTEQQKWQAGRRYTVLGTLVSAFNKLAALNSLAVIVTTGCSTRMRSDRGLQAALAPGTGGSEWEGGIWSRLVVFRDFSGRYIGVQKAQGQSSISREEVGEVGRIIGFSVADDGTVSERMLRGNIDGSVPPHTKLRSSPVKLRKRTFDEIADSEEEDEYGWAETDEESYEVLPPSDPSRVSTGHKSHDM